MKKLSLLISTFCNQKENLDLFINELKSIIVNLSHSLNNILSNSIETINQP